MNRFLQQHAQSVIGMVSGWDRLRFRGTLQSICHARGLGAFLGCTRRFYKGFKTFALESSAQVKAAALEVAQEAGRPVRHLSSPQISKEQVARECAQQDGIKEGLICVLTAVEPCSSFEIHKDPVSGRIDFQRAYRKCLHIYHYYLHPVFGFMHVRLQTWLPFDQFICINGREWLSRQLDAAGIDYLRKENCFVRFADAQAAQRMLDEQVNYNWRPALDKIAHSIAPTLGQVLTPYPTSYYWSIQPERVGQRLHVRQHRRTVEALSQPAASRDQQLRQPRGDAVPGAEGPAARQCLCRSEAADRQRPAGTGRRNPHQTPHGEQLAEDVFR